MSNEMVEQKIEEFMKTKDGRIISMLNQVGIHVTISAEGIRWKRVS